MFAAPKPDIPKTQPVDVQLVDEVGGTDTAPVVSQQAPAPSIAPGTEAVIDVFAFWGGMEIKVPEDWTVIIRAIPLMGGVDDKTHMVQPPPAVEKRLVISGIVMMGGVVVKN